MNHASVKEGLCGICGEEPLEYAKLNVSEEGLPPVIEIYKFLGYCKKARAIYNAETLKVLYNKTDGILELETVMPSFTSLESIRIFLEEHPETANVLAKLCED